MTDKTLRSRESGMTLVELMVAMVASLLLLGGVIQMFLSGRQANLLQDGLGAMQENGRFALMFLRRDIRMAGFPRDEGVDAFLVGVGLTENNTGPNNSDAIVVQYQGTTDCLGQAVAGGLVNNRYFIATDLTTGINRLMCLGNGNATSQPLVEGIDSLQFLYGEDRDADGGADLYVTVGNVADWGAVVSVRVSVLAASITGVLDETTSQSYTMLDIPVLGPFVDRQQRRTFTTSVEVRNQTP